MGTFNGHEPDDHAYEREPKPSAAYASVLSSLGHPVLNVTAGIGILAQASPMFLLVPYLAGRGEWVLFEVTLFAVFTMYGGGFATIPAFLADIFGPENVGAIHGAILTAWSAAAIAGPVIITKLSDNAKTALAPGATRIHIYDAPLHVLAVLLAIGFVLALLVRPLKKRT